MSPQPVILVTAATGTQSSGLIRALSAWSSSTSTPITIHATTRDPSSPAAQSLLTNVHSNCTITLFHTDFEDPSTLATPSTSVTHLFLNVTPVLTDWTAESRHALNILDAARSHASKTLTRIVYTSVASLRDPSDSDAFPGASFARIPWLKTYYESKFSIETAARRTADDLGINWTFLRPATFLTNLLPPASNFMYPLLKTERRIVTALDPASKLAWLDTDDIGRFAVEALLLQDDDPKYQSRYKGGVIRIAGVRLTLQEVVDSFNAALRADPKVPDGVQVTLEFLSKAEADERAETDLFVASQLFQNENAWMHDVDLQALREFGIEQGGVGGYWERNAERVRQAVGVE